VTLMNIQNLSQSSNYVTQSHFTSQIVFELRSLFKMIIQTNFLCWRSNLKKLCFGFHQVSKRSETIKPRGRRPSGFKCFLPFGKLIKTSHSFLKYYLQNFNFDLLRLDFEELRRYVRVPGTNSQILCP